ncbi:metallophosphoesterase [Agrobacterium larrymoorei]|uniref:Metallophosphoesterase n=1 Tax=Agrobacterium larrymoorei TaxID=160699 RepID=A0AAF0HEY0_9HYPH|nr:metallophosphoesterase [Agrobacterium larrymoorei]WHA43278.1 metallophosphoesterase [Agrobacterium larrymoorei]
MPSSENLNRFRWLHFSDIHVGMKGQDHLWARFGHLLDADLEKLLKRAGVVDLILFSGDMVQKGLASEFDRFDEIMAKIMDRVAEFQDRPQMIALPGNHDLTRPDPLDSHAFALSNYWEKPEIRERFWDKKGGDYRDFIGKAFESFSSWQARAIEAGVHVRPNKRGILPGDASYVLERSNGTLGVAALNSTWLQLGGGDYTGRLHVDASQLLEITDLDPDKWASSVDVSLLVTHQPPTWLHANKPSTWENDINPTGRFDMHLYGHMHVPDTSTVTHGGGHARRSVQAASLFGLEIYGAAVERIQGYSLCEVQIAEQSRKLTVWPRTLIQVSGGEMKLAQDLSQNIDENTGSFSMPYTLDRNNKSQSPRPGRVESQQTVNHSEDVALDLSRPAQFELETIRVKTVISKAHQSVRQLERDVVLAGLTRDRIAWVASDWGMGHEGFVASVRDQLNIPSQSVFALDFSVYRTRDNFFESLQNLYRVSFQEICEAIADAGPSVLVFDDIDFPSISAIDGNFEREVETLAKTVRDFATDTAIIIRSRRLTRFATLEQVELRALDEVDVGIYAAASEIGSKKYEKPEIYSKLFRHTDGVPNRIDVALRALQLISLNELMESNPDFSTTNGALVDAPAALMATVSELRASEDQQEQRAWSLLLALSALPYGEQLGRLRRFLGPHPIDVPHAQALADRSLINSVSLATFEGAETEASRTLIVPRSVRDYVRNIIDEQTAEDIDLKALELLFGKQWTTGDIQSSPTVRRVQQAMCDVYEIQNASTLILRAVRRSLDDTNSRSSESSVRLASRFVDALVKGDHFRSVIGLCEDVLALIDNDDRFSRAANILKYEYARSLRMTSRHDDALSQFKALDETFLSKRQRQSVHLGIAMCLESLGNAEDAAESAKRAIAIDRNSSGALHARTILAEQMQDNDQRIAELKRILVLAHKKQSHTLANTVSLALAEDRKRKGLPTEDLLKNILTTQKKTGDFYNVVRAIIDLAGVPGRIERLTAEERTILISAYHYLFHERLFNLFDKCHAALWKMFSHDGDAASLFNLFRLSSFIWRLNGREEQELRYLSELAKKYGDIIARGVSSTNRDGAYFIVRVSIAMGQQHWLEGETSK